MHVRRRLAQPVGSIGKSLRAAQHALPMRVAQHALPMRVAQHALPASMLLQRASSNLASTSSPAIVVTVAAADDRVAASTRNPNLGIVTVAAACDLVAAIVDRRGVGDIELIGPRPDWWWTGKAPQDAPGWVASPAAGGASHLTSLAQLNLASCTREDVLGYLDNTWALTELLFASLQGEASFYLQPYHHLRLPLIFYYGHAAALYVNKLRLAGVMEHPINAQFEALFETGVDEMSWDDTHQSSTLWPAVSEVHAYRRQVYEAVRHVIETHPDLSNGHKPILADSPLWALAMAFEHERIHLETSSVLMRELPQPLIRRPEGWVPNHPSVPNVQVFQPQPGVDYPANEMVAVEGGSVQLGKPKDYPSFGWDNEYGQASRHVASFSASRFKVSNGEFFEFVRTGGYRDRRFWSDEGWGWRTFRNAKWPTFWVSLGPQSLHQYGLRTVHEVVAMPWAWPVELNVHEAKAYCAWRTERDATMEGGNGVVPSPYRLVTEGEHLRVRQACLQPADVHDVATRNGVICRSGADFSATEENLNLAHGSPAPVDASRGPFGDAMGNIWEWCEDDFHPLDGFAVHPYYDDFSTPCFDGEHSMIMGGSWASTGDLASSYARFHFRKHFFQHAGLRLAASGAAPGAEGSAGRSGPHVTSSPHAELTDNAKADGAGYESEKLLNEYVMLHFGAAADVLPFKALPADFLHFPQRCAQLVDKWATQLGMQKARALDIGCAVGGSSFELACSFEEVIGVDLSASFIAAAQRMQDDGSLAYYRRDEGDLGEACVTSLRAITEKPLVGRVDFRRGDACALPEEELGAFDACLLANLLCRLPSPSACLRSLGGPSGLVKPGGLAVIVSPYTWMEEHTPRDGWLGGYASGNGTRVYSDATLRSLMDECGFELLGEEDMPLLIREHARKYQMIVSHAMVFQRRQVSTSHYEQAREAYESAPFYDRAEPNQALLVERIGSELALGPHDRLADIGGGNGSFANALLEHIGSETPATIVDPSVEFMRGAEREPHVGCTVNSELLDWAKAVAPHAGRASDSTSRFDRLLLKEVVHHLGGSAARQACFEALRQNRLADDGRLLLVTRHHEQPEIPLFASARDVWAANQPTVAQLTGELRAAGFTNVTANELTLTYQMPLDDWCSLVSRRFWSTFSHFTDAELERGVAEIRAQAGGDVLQIGDKLVLIAAAPEP